MPLIEFLWATKTEFCSILRASLWSQYWKRRLQNHWRR